MEENNVSWVIIIPTVICHAACNLEKSKLTRGVLFIREIFLFSFNQDLNEIFGC